MRILLDTHVWLWMQNAPRRIGGDALRLLENTENPLFLSAASSWEIAIKYSLGKLSLPSAPDAYVPERMRLSGVDPLPVTHSHALRVADLPHHHTDPFDRLLIAQAQTENLVLMTSDLKLAVYDVPLTFTD